MNLDLKPMLRGEITRLPIDFPIEPEAPYGVEFSGDVRVFGEITNQGGYMRLTATAEIPYSGEEHVFQSAFSCEGYTEERLHG